MEERAKRFAELAHEGQKRKYTGTPYIEHPAAVADLVRGIPHTEAMIAAAWLHDVAEDTKITIMEIEAEFGPDVAALVDHLTDVSRPEDGNRKKRKTIDLEHMATASPEAKTIKLADIIDNTHNIVERDPAFALIYLREKQEQLKVLQGGDATLMEKAKELVL